MAGVKSLAIRGIRSFGPDDDDEQRLSFEKPLTLILGQNGCGKTTIIECLRYAVTGQMPPGSRNECFVHDTKVNRSSEVVAQVKLKIINAKNEQLEVSRTMKVTALQKKKTKFQTLDSFLSTIDDNGKTKDISSRCADLDSVMYEQLGVSKAILNSVIFCHQEDSSWPLDEGKKVKDRFDEIFDADKYSDCFDRLRKIRKDYTQAIKLLEQEVSFLTEKKQELDKKKMDVVDTESKISEAEIKISEIAQELKPITEKIKAIQTLQKNLVSFESKREKIKTKLEHNQTQEQDMKKAIKDIFEGTTEELQEKINTYEATVKAKEKELAESHKSNFAFNKEEEKIANERTANEVTYNKLIMLESQNQEKMDKRNKMIVDTAKLAEMEMAEINTNEEAEKGIKEITNKLKSLNEELDKLKSEADSEESEYQSHIDTSRDAFTSHKQKISSKEIEIRNVKKEITKLEKAINDATESKNKLDVLEKKINDAEEEYKQLENELNPEEFQQEINDDEKVVEEHEQELDQLGEKFTKLQKQSAKLKEREMIEDILRQKERQYNMLFNKHKTAMIELLGSVPEKEFALSVNKHECSLRTEVESMKQKLKEKHIEVSGLEAERKHVRSSLKARRGELTTAEDQMYRACGTQPYDATLAKITATVDKLQDEQNVLQSSMFIIAKYKTQLKDNNCCPVCNRGFESETDVTNLISEMTTQVMNVPAKLEKVTEELQRSSAKKDELLSMKSVNDKITTLKEKEIPQLETKLSEIDKNISTLNESVDELTTSLIEPEQKLQTAKQLLTDMPLLDRFTQEIKTTNDTLDSVKAQCSDLETDMNLDDAQAKQADLKQKISTLRARIKSSNSKLNAHNKKLHKMADSRNKLKEQRLKIQEKVQQMCNLQENLKQLEANREQYNTELNELQESKGKFEDELKEKENAKNEVVQKNRAAIDVKRNYITKIVNAFDKVKYIVSEIKQHEQKNIQREMDKIKEANEKLMEKQKQIMIDRDTLTKKIDTLKEEVLKQGIIKRDLEDNLKLRKAQTEITNCEKELELVNTEINGIDTTVISELESLISKQTQLFRQKAQTEGQLRELQDRLKQCQQELKKHLNKNIEMKFREKNYELHITKGIDKDIRDYSVTLEKCLMEFHKEKMENINLIIREMWRKIYRGNDIDYIEIKTEGSMTVDSDRRKYDYRVVQCKNGVEIDMRGRCSAGQKVLACLIIRLALAETFSSRFGILALDEPTTNLDQENIHSLCAALGEIVQERMKQKNFMFIIITHDKEFIENLGNIDKVTHYYEVSRNDDGKSRVKKIKFT